MNITRTIAVINQMKSDGIIRDYAIGGAVGATFHLEPAATMDVDIFVPQPGGALISPKRHHIEGEHVHVEGWPVQFLPLNGALAEEALRDAVATEVAGVPTRVFSAEHLVALALESGRAKDKARVLQFVEAGVLDAERLQDILQRHNLVDRWRQFERTFLS